MPDVGAMIDMPSYLRSTALPALASCWLLAAMYVTRRGWWLQQEQERRSSITRSCTRSSGEQADACASAGRDVLVGVEGRIALRG